MCAKALVCGPSRQKTHGGMRGKETSLSNKIRVAAASRPARLATLCIDWVTSISAPAQQKARSAAPADTRRTGGVSLID